MVGSEGVEPSTKRLRVSCSTTELQTHLFFSEGEYAHDLESGKLNMHLEMQADRQISGYRQYNDSSSLETPSRALGYSSYTIKTARPKPHVPARTSTKSAFCDNGRVVKALNV
ncbi:MAG: hypothetical protein RL693_2175 [Verrucomicrobiota bacterium]